MSQGEFYAAKRSKNSDSAAASADNNDSPSSSKQYDIPSSTADSKGQQTQCEDTADQLQTEHSPRKENRSPNHEPSLSLLEQQFGLPDDLDCSEEPSFQSDQASFYHLDIGLRLDSRNLLAKCCAILHVAA